MDMVLLLSKPIHSSQQSPEQSVLSHIDCFSQCEVMKLEVIKNYQVHPCVLTPCEFYCIPFKYLLICCRTLMGLLFWKQCMGFTESTLYTVVALHCCRGLRVPAGLRRCSSRGVALLPCRCTRTF